MTHTNRNNSTEFYAILYHGQTKSKNEEFEY